MSVVTAILYTLGIIGIVPTTLSVLMFMFRAIYKMIWCSYNDKLDTPFWKKYEYVNKAFLTIGLFFLAVAIMWFILIILISVL